TTFALICNSRCALGADGTTAMSVSAATTATANPPPRMVSIGTCLKLLFIAGRRKSLRRMPSAHQLNEGRAVSRTGVGHRTARGQETRRAAVARTALAGQADRQA